MSGRKAIFGAILGAMLLSGCAATHQAAGQDVALVKQTLDDVAATLALISKTETTDTGGGNVYDPVIGWIAVASAPFCFSLYVVSKRFRFYWWAAGCERPGTKKTEK